MNKLVVASVAASIPTVAPAEALQAPDPIFAALEAFRSAEADFYANKPEWGDEIPEDVSDRWYEAKTAVVRRQPTTPAGLCALTSFAREMTERAQDDATLGDDQWIPIMKSIEESARGMSGLVPWTPDPAEEIDGNADPIFAAITKFREAKKKSRAAYARVSRLYKEAAKHGLGDENSLKDRDAFVEARLACHPDKFTDGPAAEHWDAADNVFSTVPTTKAGIVALIRFAADLNDDKDHYLVEDNVQSFVSSLNATTVVLPSA